MARIWQILSQALSVSVGFGSFGGTLPEAAKTSFFEWFRLEATSERAAGELRVVRYQPSGAQFHDLVRLDAFCDRFGAIARLSFSVRRDFIDGGSASFAADIVKSFLGAALADADRREMEALTAQIEAAMAGGAIVFGGGPGAPAGPTHLGMFVYSGARDRWETALRQGLFLMENGELEGVEWLTIVIGPG